TTLNETTLVSKIPYWSTLYGNRFLRFQHLWCTLAALIPAVAEPPELSQLKCIGHHHKGNTGSNALQTEQFLVCRVTPDTTTGSRIEQAYPARRRVQRYYNHMFYKHKLGSDYKPVQNIIIEPNLVKTVIQTITLSSEFEKQRKEKTM